MRVLVLTKPGTALPCAVRLALSKEGGGYTPYVFDNEEALFEAEDTYDLVFVIPSEDWISPPSFIDALRKKNIHTPIIVVRIDDRASSDEVCACFNAGANGYLDTPLRMEEVSAYVHAILRRSAGQPSSIITVDDLSIDLRKKRVTKAGILVHLTYLEYSVLEALALRRGRILSQSQIYFLAKGDNAGDRDGYNLVTTFVSKIRAKLGDKGLDKYIQTKRGLGLIIPHANAQAEL